MGLSEAERKPQKVIFVKTTALVSLQNLHLEIPVGVSDVFVFSSRYCFAVSGVSFFACFCNQHHRHQAFVCVFVFSFFDECMDFTKHSSETV